MTLKDCLDVIDYTINKPEIILCDENYNQINKSIYARNDSILFKTFLDKFKDVEVFRISAYNSWVRIHIILTDKDLM